MDILNIKTIKNVKDKDYTRFIIDAPCSGSGTWRRTPDAKFRITPQRLREILGIQAEILEFGAEHTAGGADDFCQLLPAPDGLFLAKASGEIFHFQSETGALTKIS